MQLKVGCRSTYGFVSFDAAGLRSTHGKSMARKLKDGTQAGPVVLQGHGNTVQIGNRRDKLQAETAAGCGAAAVEPVESFEDTLALGLRDARAAVGHATDEER